MAQSLLPSLDDGFQNLSDLPCLSVSENWTRFGQISAPVTHMCRSIMPSALGASAELILKRRTSVLTASHKGPSANSWEEVAQILICDCPMFIVLLLSDCQKLSMYSLVIQDIYGTSSF